MHCTLEIIGPLYAVDAISNVPRCMNAQRGMGSESACLIRGYRSPSESVQEWSVNVAFKHVRGAGSLSKQLEH